MIESLFKKYFQYVDKNEEYEKKYKASFSGLVNEIQEVLKTKSLKDLINLFKDLLRIQNIQQLNGDTNLFDILYVEIMNKLDTVSIMKLIDLYIDISKDTLISEDNLNSSQNVINVTVEKLNDEFILEYEASKKGVSKEKIIESYQNKLLDYRQYNLNFAQIHLIIGELKQKIFAYINEQIPNIDQDLQQKLIYTLRSRIEDNSKKIIEKNILRSDKDLLKIKSRFEYKNPYQIYHELLDSTEDLKRKNFIYELFEKNLVDLVDNQKRSNL